MGTDLGSCGAARGHRFQGYRSSLGSHAGEQGDENVPPPLFITVELVGDFEWPQMFRSGSESRAQALRCLSTSSEGRSVILLDSECGEREGE